MTVLRERKRDAGIYAWFLIVILAVAAWRGASGAPVLAAVCGAFAVATFAGWLVLRRRPPDSGGISMIGFDLHEVGRVCADHGWTVR